MTKAKVKEYDDLDANGYRLNPIDVSEDCWLYENENGLYVVQRGMGVTLDAKITWQTICALADNHRKLSKR